MSRKCVGYAGEGRSRRPIWADEGPASASASNPVAMHERVSIPGQELAVPMQGAGQIERRQIYAAEDDIRAQEAREARLARTTPPTFIPTREDRQRAAHNGAQRRLEVLARPKPATSVQEAPTVSQPSPTLDNGALPPTAYTTLAAAAMEAAEALEAKSAADARWDSASRALEAAWAEVQGTQLPLLEPEMPAPVVRSGADHAPRIPSPAKRQPGRHPGKADEAKEKAERAKVVMAAMERHGGDVKAVAVALGMKANAVAMVVKHARLREAQA